MGDTEYRKKIRRNALERPETELRTHNRNLSEFHHEKYLRSAADILTNLL